MEGIIVSLAIFIFLAHLFSILFVKMRVPDVLPLMLLGLLLGPVFQVVQPGDFGKVDQVFTRVLLIVILFRSGLDIRISQIRSTWAQSSRITVLGFLMAAAVIALAAKVLLGLNLIYSITLGFILADNSFAVIIPLISKLNISKNIRTILLVECTMTSVLSIGGAVTLIGMVKANSFNPSIIAAKIIYSLLISLLVGGTAAVFWTTVLNKVRKLENGIFLTLAFVLVVYYICEKMGSDGAIGAFIFGIVAANLRVIRRLYGFRFLQHFTTNVKSKAFNETELNFFSEIVFVLRTFFFVYIGISMQLSNVYSMLCGLVLTLVILISRVPIVNYLLSPSINRLDTAVAAAMMPKGLVTAVLASLIVQSGIPGGQLLKDTIYSVILFSIILSTVLSFLIEKGYACRLSDFLFARHEGQTCKTPVQEVAVVNKTVILK